MIRHDETTPAYYVRRGTLYGAAIGMLAGLAFVAIRGDVGRAAIEIWRNWIIAVALIGWAAGSVRAIRMKRHSNTLQHDGEPRPEAGGPQHSS